MKKQIQKLYKTYLYKEFLLKIVSCDEENFLALHRELWVDFIYECQGIIDTHLGFVLEFEERYRQHMKHLEYVLEFIPIYVYFRKDAWIYDHYRLYFDKSNKKLDLGQCWAYHPETKTISWSN